MGLILYIRKVSLNNKSQKMIEIKYKDSHPFDYSGNQLIVTYAEEGFSPLSIHMKSMGYDKEEIVDFANSINESDNTKSLLPDFPLLAIPRRLIRDTLKTREFMKYLNEILAIVAANNTLNEIVFDFRTPQTDRNIKDIVSHILFSAKLSNLNSFGFVEF